MSYKIELTDNFIKEAKKLIKKYPSLRSEIAELGKELAENPTTGTPLGNDVYKIRLAIASKNKGKSGGARVISFVKLLMKRFTCYLSLIKEKKIQFRTKKLKSFWKAICNEKVSCGKV
jgi:mRNA-degrading endonuclease RelE of RelBE toxin-antitoxin system